MELRRLHEKLGRLTLAAGKREQARADRAFRWTTTCANREFSMVVACNQTSPFRLPAPGRWIGGRWEQWRGRCAHLAAMIRVRMRDAMHNEIRMPRIVPGTARPRVIMFTRVHLAALIRARTPGAMPIETQTQRIVP